MALVFSFFLSVATASLASYLHVGLVNGSKSNYWCCRQTAAFKDGSMQMEQGPRAGPGQAELHWLTIFLYFNYWKNIPMFTSGTFNTAIAPSSPVVNASPTSSSCSSCRLLTLLTLPSPGWTSQEMARWNHIFRSIFYNCLLPHNRLIRHNNIPEMLWDERIIVSEAAQYLQSKF